MRWVALVGVLLLLSQAVLAEELRFEQRESAFTSEELDALLPMKAEDERPFLDESYRDILMDEEAIARANGIVTVIYENASALQLAKAVAGEELERFLIQVRSDCDLSGVPSQAIKTRITTDNATFLVIMAPKVMVASVLESDCLIKMADAAHAKSFIAYAEGFLDEETRLKLAELDMGTSSNDVTSYEFVQELLDEAWEKAKGEYSPLQEFVTPEEPSIRSLAAGKTPEEIFPLATAWIWMSDKDLFDESEKWLKPAIFIRETPMLESPASGKQVSDCSEQANTLVSLLRAAGVSAKEVRVVIGEVEFEDNKSGGHAWTEMRMDDTWVVLDSTVGPMVSEGRLIEREGLAFDYWKYHEFPILETWAYYNDEYFLDLRDDHAPKEWDEAAGTLFGKEMKEGLQKSWLDRLIELLLKLLGIIF